MRDHRPRFPTSRPGRSQILQHSRGPGFWRQRQLGTNCALKNRYSILETDDSRIDHANMTFAAQEIEKVSQVATPPRKEYVRSNRQGEFPCLKIELKTVGTGATLTADALLDSGATGLYVDSEFIRMNALDTRKLARAIPVYNVDGTLNNGGAIKET